jgi:hypothetical protein
MTDIGNRCVHCGADTSFGSGLFVNRIPADADYQAEDSEGNIIFKDGEYRDGYACAPCMALDCDRCDVSIPLDEDITADDCDLMEFSDGAYRVHECCLTEEETKIWKKLNF